VSVRRTDVELDKLNQRALPEWCWTKQPPGTDAAALTAAAAM
jgi:hypothetical protein